MRSYTEFQYTLVTGGLKEKQCKVKAHHLNSKLAKANK